MTPKHSSHLRHRLSTHFEHETVLPMDTTTSRLWNPLARAVSGRRSWVILLLALLVTGGVMALGESSSTSSPQSLPADSESAKVSELLKQFPGSELAPAIAVVSRADGAALTPADLTAASTARERMLSVDRGPAAVSAAASGTAQPAAPGMPSVIPSQDGQIALVSVPIDSSLSGFALNDAVKNVRAAGRDGLPSGLSLQVTGGPAFGADIANSFSGANVRLLLVTAGVVALLLLLTYRSPVLWLVPLLVVGTADRVAAIVSALAAGAVGLEADGSTSGITSVLVFGAGTNYALLIVSRYREELRREADHRVALQRAVRAAGPAVLASNVTVVLALLTLLVALTPANRVLGLCAAVGLLVALAFCLLVLPPALALAGRRLFWPFIPRLGDADRAETSTWHTVAAGVVRRPLVTLLATVPVLLIFVAGLVGTRVGLAQTELFRVQAESVDAYRVLAQHLPTGSADPTIVIAAESNSQSIPAQLTSVPGVVSVTPTGRSSTGLVRFSVVLDSEPATDRALATIDAIRASLSAVPGQPSLVGGADAQQRDSAAAADRDLRVIVPMILAVVLVVLLVLLRAVIAPLVLIGATILSAFAALGAGAWLSSHVFGFPGLDRGVPLFSFLFLVALGVDYTIFLVTRAKEETPGHGTRDGIIRAVSLTGGVITSAGIVLAAVFAVLGVLPLITLTQIGIVVGIGILLDTFVVRTIVIPALFALIGPRVWWPSALSREESVSPAPAPRDEDRTPVG